MNLYLLRHGEAEPASGTGDTLRALTEAGRQEVITVARQFASRNLSIDSCYVSPALRAQQTASIFLEQTFNAPQITTIEELSANKRASQLMAFLDKSSSENILLVSHNPILSELLALMTHGNVDRMHILDTGNLACIQFDIMGLGMGSCPFILEPDAVLGHIS